MVRQLSSAASVLDAYQPKSGMRLRVGPVNKQLAKFEFTGPHDLCRSASCRCELPARA